MYIYMYQAISAKEMFNYTLVTYLSDIYKSNFIPWIAA